jgi:redox-sensitive bicupin YhaK (pirin superfamily)
MSGPVRRDDLRTAPPGDEVPEPGVEVWTSRTSDVGGATVRRALPVRSHRTVGAWCFLDHFGPAPARGGQAMTIGPHPHIGLQTVTWVLDGELDHTDSLGSAQRVRPGQLNLMTAGHGVAHAEDSRAADVDTMHGVQLWVALPETTRHGPAAFEHHDVLPTATLDGASATVIVGSFADATSPARTDTPLVGVDLVLHGAVELPVAPGHEHVLVVLDGSLEADGRSLGADHAVYHAPGPSSLAVRAAPGSRALLLGGEPLGEEIFMWCNFVARTRDVVEEAYLDWQAGHDRFGPVATDLARIDAPRPHWLT